MARLRLVLAASRVPARHSDYWSGTEVVLGILAGAFGFVSGHRGLDIESGDDFAWAVRPGDVDAAAAPEPASLLLFGLGALGLGWARRRKS